METGFQWSRKSDFALTPHSNPVDIACKREHDTRKIRKNKKTKKTKTNKQTNKVTDYTTIKR